MYIVNRNVSYIEINNGVKSKLIFGNNNKKEVLITIAIPTFKRPKLLNYAIKSALSQSEISFAYEVIVVDNESVFGKKTDTEKILEKYRDNDKFSYYRNIENLGMAGNWNRCFELAKGEWVALLHDDDMLKPKYLQRIAYFMKKRYADCYCVNRERIYNDKDINFQEKAGNKCFKNKIENILKNKMVRLRPSDAFFTDSNVYLEPSCGTLINKKKFIEFGGFDLNSVTADVFFFIDFNREHLIYQTIESLGYYRYYLNESFNPETLCAFFKAEKKIIDNLQYENVFHQFWSRKFKNTCETVSLLGKIDFQKKEKREETRNLLMNTFPDVSLKLTQKAKFIKSFQRWYTRFKKIF